MLSVSSPARAHSAIREERLRIRLSVRSHPRLIHPPRRQAAESNHLLRHDLTEAAEYQHRQIMTGRHVKAAGRRELRIDDAPRRHDQRIEPRPFIIRQTQLGRTLSHTSSWRGLSAGRS